MNCNHGHLDIWSIFEEKLKENVLKLRGFPDEIELGRETFYISINSLHETTGLSKIEDTKFYWKGLLIRRSQTFEKGINFVYYLDELKREVNVESC